MIKVCSLDFLNNASFETDVKSSDGKILVHIGEKVTPEIILKLYFKDIYVDQPLEEKIPALVTASKVKEEEVIETVTDIAATTDPKEYEDELPTVVLTDIEQSISTVAEDKQPLPEEEIKTEVELTQPIEDKEVMSVEESTIEPVVSEVTQSEPEFVETVEVENEEVVPEEEAHAEPILSEDTPAESEPVQIKNDKEVALVEAASKQSTPKALENKPIEPDSVQSVEEKKIESDKIVEQNDSKVSDAVLSAATNSGVQPISVEEPAQVDPKEMEFNNEFFIKQDAEEKKKGPRRAEANYIEEEENTSDVEKTGAEPEPEVVVEPEVIHIDPDEMPLVFDEDQAKRIVELSLLIGKTLNFSSDDLKNLEQVAYYSNIGVDCFKRADMKRRDFGQRKMYASYEKLKNEELVSLEIAEAVKDCASSYDSEAFPLDSNIPYHHIVAITNYYEDLLSKNMPKQDALLKMLQLGGNKFNMFILHKFIRLMRENK